MSDTPPAPTHAIETGDFTREPAPARDEIVVCAYNVERGHHLDEQVRAFASGDVPKPDVLLLSEADRGCTRTGSREVARELASAMAMHYAFGIEFIELPRWWGPGGRVCRRCEHGNAVLSRYPLEDVRVIRHTAARNWNSRLQRWLRLGEPRLGGRVAVAADVRIRERLLRVYAVHFESGRDADGYREAEARELIADAATVTHGIVIGGDMNVGRYLREPEPATAALAGAGYADAHAMLPPDGRATTDSGVAIDLIFGRDVAFTDAGIGSRQVWGGLSDHRPVWAKVKL